MDQISEVFVMGMYHSGTNAMIREIQQRFDVPVYPNNKGGHHPNGHWKHSLQGSPYQTDPNKLAIVMIKEPRFWLQSLRRRKYELEIINKERGDVDQLMGSVKLDGVHYPSTMHLWNTYAKHYQDPGRFPTENTMVIRFEDFLYKFGEVMGRLYAVLPARPGVPRDMPPNGTAGKNHGTHCRNRQEAEAYYSVYTNCYSGITPTHMDTIDTILDRDSLEALGYPCVPEMADTESVNGILETPPVAIKVEKRIPKPIVPLVSVPGPAPVTPQVQAEKPNTDPFAEPFYATLVEKYKPFPSRLTPNIHPIRMEQMLLGNYAPLRQLHR